MSDIALILSIILLAFSSFIDGKRILELEKRIEYIEEVHRVE